VDELKQIVSSVVSYPGGAALSDRADTALVLMQMVLDKWFAGGAHLIQEQGRFWYYDTTHWREASDSWIRGKVLEAITTSGVGLAAMSEPVAGKARREQ
jgi:hypothetical protein